MALAKTSLSTIQSVVGIATTTIYTNSTNTKSYIKAFVLHNVGITTGIQAYCLLHQVPNVSGSIGTAGTTNQFFSQYLNAGETTFLEYPYPLTLTGTNDTIVLRVLTANQRINVQILGDKDP